MTDNETGNTSVEAISKAVARLTLSRTMRLLCSEIAASSYMVLELTFDRGRPVVSIVVSNWVYDAVECVGLDCLARIAARSASAVLGAMPEPLLPASAGFLTQDEIEALVEHGHSELHCRRIEAGRRRVFGIFSSALPRQMSTMAVAGAHMTCTYAFAEYEAASRTDDLLDPLSQRERECLIWVSEGKTSDEVALILGVSSNTINSYITNAIQKFGASNRAMAIATAVRSGII